MTTYVRTLGGTKVHLSGCRYAVNGVPWLWAEGMTPVDIRDVSAMHGITLKWCAACFSEVTR